MSLKHTAFPESSQTIFPSHIGKEKEKLKYSTKHRCCSREGSFFPPWVCVSVCGGGTAVECGKIINYSTCMQQCSRCAELLLLLSQQTLRQDYRNYAHIRYVTVLKTCHLKNKCISTGTLGIPFYNTLYVFFFFYAIRGSTRQITRLLKQVWIDCNSVHILHLWLKRVFDSTKKSLSSNIWCVKHADNGLLCVYQHACVIDGGFYNHLQHLAGKCMKVQASLTLQPSRFRLSYL